MICDIYDNVLDLIAELIDMEMKEIIQYDYKSHGQEVINIATFCAKQLNQSIVFLTIWETAKKKNEENIKFNILKEFIVMHTLMV